VASACAGGIRPVTPIAVDAGAAAGMVSAFREENGLGPVGVDSRLMEAAADQARAMGERDKIGHSVAGSLPRRLGRAGYDWAATAENLGAGYASLPAAIEGWKASADHRKNLLNSYVTEIGVAAVATPPGSKKRTYWALIVGMPRPQAVAAGPFAMGAAQ
jgi:uncharacterized protein YkwD